MSYETINLITQLPLHEYRVHSAYESGIEVLSADQIIIYNWFINLITAQVQNDCGDRILQM